MKITAIAAQSKGISYSAGPLSDIKVAVEKAVADGTSKEPSVTPVPGFFLRLPSLA